MSVDRDDIPLLTTCRACSPELGEALVPVLQAAAHNLELDGHLEEVALCVDDLTADDTGWLRLDPGPESGVYRLTVYCGGAALAASGPGGQSTRGEVYAWERPTPMQEEMGAEDVDAVAAAAFVHHQLLLARDLMTRDLDPALVPDSLAETFAAAWDVVLDGRLARTGLPGYALEIRRARFSNLFSSASVLMPHHWQIFQSLWDGGLVDQAAVLAAVRQLPRL